MNSNIIDRELIKLPESQIKMIQSGWGKDSVDNALVEKIVYKSDGLNVKGYLAYPKNAEGKSPCIIWNRGGAGERGFIDDFTATGIFGQMASWGYVVFASMYRNKTFSGKNEEFGGADVNDVVNMITLAEELPFADSSKWGIEGWSRGGMTTFLTLIKRPVFKCCLVTGAISNVAKTIDENPKLRETIKEAVGRELTKDEMEKRSVINFVDKLPKETAYLIMHGGNDEIVSPSQSIELAKKFTLNNLNYRFIILEGGDHFLKNHRSEVDELRRNWFSRYL